jgi:hypothetical protein
MNRGNAGKGRPKGSQNKSTGEVRDLARALVNDPEYRRNLDVRLKRGKLAPMVESMLWHYAYGKPKETVEHTGENGGPVNVVFGGRYRPE